MADKRQGALRKFVQSGWGILTNAYVKGFLPGGPPIYKGPLKQFCVPGMNCYSCPGALGSCPIGSMQAVFDARHRRFAFYVVGYLSLIGLIVGRFICGWLCLFGLIQELLYKIPAPKLKVPEKIDRPLRYLKYLMLFVMVFALPFFVRSAYGAGAPFFCKYICPVGTLEGGIPLVLLNDAMRSTLGWLFRWKFLLLIICVLSSVFIYRPFCKYICPLGAFYGLFQKVSLVKMHVDEHACVNCGLCARTCKMNVDPRRTPNSSECIRCRECVNVCPKHALSMGIREKDASGSQERSIVKEEMKKMRIMSAVLLALSMSFVLTGCGSKNNESKSESQSVSESKSESQGVSERKTCTYECPGVGYGFDLPEGVTIANGFLDIHDMGDVDYDSGVMMGWPVYRDIKEEDLYGMTEEEYKQKVHTGFSFSILCVKDVNSEEEAKEKVFALMKKMLGEVPEKDREVYSGYKQIHQENGYIWMMGMESRADTIREECKEEYNAFYDATDKIISNMKFFTPEVWKGSEEGTAISFETIDLNGNPVKSETLFAQNKVTMINIWATTCGPCINELPELEEMNKEFRQKGGAIVGLLDDVWVSNMKYLDEAKEIVEDTGVTFTNLCAWDGYDTVLSAVGTPTTYFVDSQGSIIGEPILGANPAKYREKMEEYLAQAK